MLLFTYYTVLSMISNWSELPQNIFNYSKSLQFSKAVVPKLFKIYAQYITKEKNQLHTKL